MWATYLKIYCKQRRAYVCWKRVEMLGPVRLRQVASFLQQSYSCSYLNLDHKQAQVNALVNRAMHCFHNQRYKAKCVLAHQDTQYGRDQHDFESMQSSVFYPLDQQDWDQPLQA